MTSSWLIAFAAVLSGAPGTGATHPFSVHDMAAMDRISEPRVSRDGGRVAFTVRTTDLEANGGKYSLWLVGADGTGLRRLTSSRTNDRSPRWAPDGKTVFFLSGRSGSSQVWRIATDGGEAEQVTDLPLDVDNLIISPDGRHLGFTMEVFPGSTYDETKNKLDEQGKRKGGGRIYDRLFIRHWDAWSDGRRSHLFVMPSAGKRSPIDVMMRMDADTPSKPWGGPEEFTFTPDGREVVFTARDAGRKEAWSTDFDLYRAPIDGSKSPTCLTEANPAWDWCPTFSPDGKWLAYLAMQQAGYEADRFRIVLRRWPEGETKVLTEAWDRSPTAAAWSSDGTLLYAAAPHLGQTSLFAVDAASGKVRLVVKEGNVNFPAASGAGAVYTHDHLKSPAELFWVRSDGSGLRRLTDLNAEKVSAARMGDFEQFSFKGFQGETVYGYAVKPVDFDPARKYPVVLLIHGGPQQSFGNEFHYRWNPQAYAGAGYAVVMIDFHGSTGYGQAFTDSIRGDWGGKPLEDLKKGLAAALERYRWMDGTRVGALGASYGGYMVNWIAGNWPDRFRCLVNHDGTFDSRMNYFETDELWFDEWEHHGTPWSNPEGFEKQNPANFVRHWKTPMLVVHGAKDYRIADCQGLATFTALQRLGIPSKLLYFPDENHWIQRPRNSIQWHETVFGWLDRWLKREEGRRAGSRE